MKRKPILTVIAVLAIFLTGFFAGTYAAPKEPERAWPKNIGVPPGTELVGP